ncbi:hypothetical protein ROZALSC1DRAFT_28989, partial [Rozella allomycis CSF55]
MLNPFIKIYARPLTGTIIEGEKTRYSLLDTGNLTDVQKHKFILLCDEMYDRTTGIVTIEAKKFPLLSQNIKYAKDTFKSMLKEVKNPVRCYGDNFTDIPFLKRKVFNAQPPPIPRHW